MVIVMKHTATAAEIGAVVAHVEKLGFSAHLSQGTERTIIGVVGDNRPLEPHLFELLDGVENVVRILQPFKLASREFHPEDTVIAVGDHRTASGQAANGNGKAPVPPNVALASPADGELPGASTAARPGDHAATTTQARREPIQIGAQRLIVIAGPCAVESRSQLLETAIAVKEAGASMLRGGAYKPRTSPYSFQGLGEEGLEILAEAREATGLPVVTEVMSPEAVPLVAKYADILQIGARNMQNYALLQAAGKAQTPVLLKRGMMNTVQEWLMSAEYVLSSGNYQVILCERGIRTFETATRNTLDINAIPLLKGWTHLPVFADPSHGTGKWELVAATARAAIAAGADGLMIEVHPRPDEALSDGAQSLKPERFAELMGSLRRLAPAVGRTI
jgi:3-deoxy-7-phosphoheptulonate synthase